MYFFCNLQGENPDFKLGDSLKVPNIRFSQHLTTILNNPHQKEVKKRAQNMFFHQIIITFAFKYK